MENNNGSFLKGLLFGAAAGAIAGVLLAPKSGKETREDIKDMAAKLKSEAAVKFDEARSLVMEQVANLKIAGKKIDQQKYFDIINEVVTRYRDEKNMTLDASKQLVGQLKRDWNKVHKVFAGKPEAVETKITE